jgi:hypothetical protein
LDAVSIFLSKSQLREFNYEEFSDRWMPYNKILQEASRQEKKESSAKAQ